MERLILPITFKAPAKSTDGTMHIGEFYPTVNHVYINVQVGKRRIKIIKPEAKNLLEEMEWYAKIWAKENKWKIPNKKAKVIVNIWYFFRDNKSRPDTHNLPKTILDVLQEVIFHNDKQVLVREQDFDFDKERSPRIELSFEVVE